MGDINRFEGGSHGGRTYGRRASLLDSRLIGARDVRVWDVRMRDEAERYGRLPASTRSTSCGFAVCGPRSLGLRLRSGPRKSSFNPLSIDRFVPFAQARSVHSPQSGISVAVGQVSVADLSVELGNQEAV